MHEGVTALVGLVAHQFVTFFTEQRVPRGAGDHQAVLVNNKGDAVGADFLRLEQLRQALQIQVNPNNAGWLLTRAIYGLRQRNDQLLDRAGRINIAENTATGLQSGFVPRPGARVVGTVLFQQGLAAVAGLAGREITPTGLRRCLHAYSGLGKGVVDGGPDAHKIAFGVAKEQIIDVWRHANQRESQGFKLQRVFQHVQRFGGL